MARFLKVMPDFQIIANNTHLEYTFILKYLVGFADMVSRQDPHTTFQVTPHSFWRGCNSFKNIDFISILRRHTSNEIPQNVVSEFESLAQRFGKVVFKDDLSVQVRSPELITEITSNNGLKVFIDKVEGDVITFKSMTRDILKRGFEIELGLPIEGTPLNQYDIIIKGEYGEEVYQVLGTDPFSAIKDLFNKSTYFNLEVVKIQFQKTESQITTSLIHDFMAFVFEGFVSPSKRPNILEIAIKESFM